MGFFPFELCGPIAKPIARELSDCQAVIADPTWNWDPTDLISAPGLAVYDPTYHRAQQVPLQPFHRGVHWPSTGKLEECIEPVIADLKRCNILEDSDASSSRTQFHIKYANVIFDLEFDAGVDKIADQFDHPGCF